MDIKLLYKFSVDIEKEVEKIQTVTVDGQTYDKKIKAVEKVPVFFGLRKPNREQFEDIRLFYGIQQNKAITEGFLTKGMMVNKYANTTGGIFNQEEAKELLKLLHTRQNVDDEFKQAVVINASEETKKELMGKLLNVNRQILEIELSNQSLFNHTAEYRAREKTITYMFYCFTYYEKDGKWIPFFSANDDTDVMKRFALKQAQHFALEDKEDPLLLSVRERLLSLYAHYYEGAATKEEDFKNIEEQIQKQFAPIPQDASKDKDAS